MRKLHSGPRFRGTFRHVRQAVPGTCGSCRTTASGSQPTYLDFADRFESARQVLTATDQTTVPCNNDLLGRQLRPRTGDVMWLID